MDWTIQFDEAVSRYLPDLKVVCDEPMSRHTTFRIGGPAKRMAYPSSREQLVEISLNYIRFLTDHPAFRRVIMQNFQDCDEEYRCLRGQLSTRTYETVSRYCEEVHMPEDVRTRKTFIVRAIIYSAALFFDNGELEYNRKNLKQVRELLEREFDLP